MTNYDIKKTQNHLITKINREIRDLKLINKIENPNIKIIILLCGANHFINLYNLINSNSLIKNHQVNSIIYDNIISDRKTISNYINLKI